MSAVRNDDNRQADSALDAKRSGGGSYSDPPLWYVEQIKLTATYLNTVAAGIFIAGVISPIASVLYGAATTNRDLARIVAEAVGLLCASAGMHYCARIVLKALRVRVLL